MPDPHELNLDIDQDIRALQDLARGAAEKQGPTNPSWHQTFELAVGAVIWRVYGVKLHFAQLHAWIPNPSRTMGEAEYQIASLLFNMDSALECFCFALNALGNAQDPASFRDINSDVQLKRVNPNDILDSSVPGYARFFPTLLRLWQDLRTTIQTIVDQHDASKHRQMLFTGGTQRIDPPSGFNEAFGPAVRPSHVAPWSRVLLRDPPKEPIGVRWARPEIGAIVLEDLCADFGRLMGATVKAAITDARAHFTCL